MKPSAQLKVCMKKNDSLRVDRLPPRPVAGSGCGVLLEVLDRVEVRGMSTSRVKMDSLKT